MSAAGIIRTVVVSATIVSLPAPSELMLDRIDGFTLTSEPATDLTYEEYAQLEPDSVGHIEPGSDAANGMSAAVEVWSNATDDQRIDVELVRALDEAGATSFVDQAAALSIAIGLAAVDPPFDGAWSYAGPADEAWTEMVAWSQGPYAVTLTLLAAAETDGEVMREASVRQVQLILDATGIEVDDAAAVADEAPPPPTESPSDDTDESAGSGISIGKVLLWLVIIGGGIVLLVKFGRKRPGGDSGSPADARSADDVITDARRTASEQAPAPTGSTDEIVERAHREARADVERIDDGWKMPDDY
jgi:hypothetical protein